MEARLARFLGRRSEGGEDMRQTWPAAFLASFRIETGPGDAAVSHFLNLAIPKPAANIFQFCASRLFFLLFIALAQFILITRRWR